jgi:hypothetical protein
MAHTISSVADGGTITFTDGTRLWNHDPERLRVILERYGVEAVIGSHGVLRVPSKQGAAYCFSVAAVPDPLPTRDQRVPPGRIARRRAPPPKRRSP